MYCINFKKTAVVFCISKDYWGHLVAAVASLVEHNKSLNIIVFYEKDSKRKRTILHNYVIEKSNNIEFRKFDNNLVTGFPVMSYLGLGAYYRLFIPEILKHEYQRVLYLDTDIIILKPLSYLINTDLGGHALSTGQNFFNINIDYHFLLKTFLTSEILFYYEKYFCSHRINDRYDIAHIGPLHAVKHHFNFNEKNVIFSLKFISIGIYEAINSAL